MGKKMKLPFLVKKSEVRSSSSWGWPSCHQPRTLSFRANSTHFFEPINSDSSAGEGDPVETVVRGLQSDRRRLFFEPDETSSILETKASVPGGVPFKDSVVLSMNSQDPYVDFRESMKEMVKAHALERWEALQELFCWYLRVNAKSNHAYIVAAFVDLLVGLAFASASSSSSSPSPSSPLSFSTSSLSSSFSTRCVNSSCLEAEEEIDTTTPTSFSFSQHVKEDIDHRGEASSSSA